MANAEYSWYLERRFQLRQGWGDSVDSENQWLEDVISEWNSTFFLMGVGWGTGNMCIFVESLELFQTHEMLGVTCSWYVFEFSTGNMSRCVYCSFTSLKPINGESCSTSSFSQTQHLWQKTPVILPLNWGPRRCRWESSGQPVDRYMYSYPPGNNHLFHQTGKGKSSTQEWWLVRGFVIVAGILTCVIYIYIDIYSICVWSL